MCCNYHFSFLLSCKNEIELKSRYVITTKPNRLSFSGFMRIHFCKWIRYSWVAKRAHSFNGTKMQEKKRKNQRRKIKGKNRRKTFTEIFLHKSFEIDTITANNETESYTLNSGFVMFNAQCAHTHYPIPGLHSEQSLFYDRMKITVSKNFSNRKMWHTTDS